MMPVTDAGHWAAMLTAGTLGTVAGDLVEDRLGLGGGLGLAPCAAVLLAAVLDHGALSRPGLAAYWATIVAARAAGTVAGDVLAKPDGLALELPAATACSLALLLSVLLVRRPGHLADAGLAARPGAD